MSGFFLCWHREGGSLAAQVIDDVAARLAHRGPEGLTRRDVDGAVALHARFTAATGAEEDLPIALDGWLLAGDIRLDARDALRARLRDHEAPPVGASDAMLLVHALRAWGAEATRRIIGDYAYAAVDTRQGRLVAARGTLGVKGLFVVEAPAYVACSNDVDALLALPGVDSSPDDRAIAQFLRQGTIVDAKLTARRGVRRVEASTQLAWARRGTARRERHWHFPVPARVRFWREEEYLEQFHEMLEDAVADRLRAPRAGILLSGGLDAPALAAAARVAAGAVALQALTVSGERITRDAAATWARRVAAHLALPLEIAHTEDGALDHCADPRVRTPEPVAGFELLAWRRRAAQLARFGPVAMSGEDGDALLSPPDLWTMLRTIPWGQTLRAWRAYQRATGERPWLGLRDSPLASRPDGGVAPHWLRTNWQRNAGQRPAARHPLRPRAVAELSSPRWEALFTEHDSAVTGVPTSIVLPLLDPRVIEYVFAIPPIPWSQRKTLIRRAFRGRLPDDLLARHTTAVAKPHEAAVARWRAGGGATRSLPVSMEHWIDVEAWRRTLHEERDAERVVEAWRVFEVSRWLAQP